MYAQANLRANKNTDHILVLPHRQRNKSGTNSKVFLYRNFHPFIRHRRNYRLPNTTARRIQKRKHNIVFRFYTHSKRRAFF